MKLLHYYILLSLVFINIGCQNKNGTSYQVINSEFKIDTVCKTLDENIELLGHISDMHFISDSLFLLSTQEMLCLYNTRGEQLKVIGNKGNAEGEYISPDMIFATNRYIYLWCAMQLKVLRYDIAGNFVDVFCRMDKSIKEFKIAGDSIMFYREANDEKNVIHKFNANTEEDSILDNIESSATYRVLSRKKQLKMMNYKDGSLIVVNPVPQFELLLFDNDGTLTKRSDQVIDEEYSVAEFASNQEFMDLGMQEGFRQSIQSSIILAVSKIKSNYYVLTESGRFSLDNNHVKSIDRKINIFKMSENLDVISKSIYPYLIGSRYEFVGDKLYFIMLDAQTEKYSLMRVSI